jgi:multisubunit Na+/H+ antiporter MnhB subunit
MAELVLDITLAVLLLSMAWGALHAAVISTGIGLFVAFGIVLALTWARLGAPDLALAEAAIGAGLTGVLLLHAARAIPVPTTTTVMRPLQMIPSILLILLVLGLLTVITSSSPDSVFQQTPPLPDLVEERIADSGVEHPVTAVLMNFRAWDTLLELFVLLLAVFGVRQLFPGQRVITRTGTQLSAADKPVKVQPWPPLMAWMGVLAPLLVLTGGYLLWHGSTAPGGAFQAGAILAAAAAVLHLTQNLPALRWSLWPVRALICGGALLFLMVAISTAWLGAGWLHYPQPVNKLLIVTIEVLATLSIAVTLALLVAGDSDDFTR